MSGSLPHDATLFQALHEAIVAHDANDRRAGERHTYHWPLLAATLIGDQMPDQSEFHHVQCNDLSLSGLSFSSTEPFEHPLLVVALGRVPFTFTLAQIVHREKKTTLDGPLFVFGCRLVKRLN